MKNNSVIIIISLSFIIGTILATHFPILRRLFITRKELDEEVVDKGVRVFVNPSTVLKIFGTELDYIDEKIKSGFVFINPNEKGKCGCGESVLL